MTFAFFFAILYYVYIMFILFYIFNDISNISSMNVFAFPLQIWNVILHFAEIIVLFLRENKRWKGWNAEKPPFWHFLLLFSFVHHHDHHRHPDHHRNHHALEGKPPVKIPTEIMRCQDNIKFHRFLVMTEDKRKWWGRWMREDLFPLTVIVSSPLARPSSHP